MKNIIEKIEVLMTENEVIKNNALKIIVSQPDNQSARRMWSIAKTENQAYQNVLDLIEDDKNSFINQYN